MSRTTYSPREGTETTKAGIIQGLAKSVKQPIYLARGRKQFKEFVKANFLLGKTTYSPREGTETRNLALQQQP